MHTSYSFCELNLKDDFDSFFNEIYCEWENAWIRKKEHIGTEFYTIKDNLKVWKKFYLNSNINLLIFQSTQKNLGYIGYQIDGDTLIITELLIKKSERGNGLGKIILAQFMELIQESKIKFTKYQLETHDSNFSNKIYLKAGFSTQELILNDRENNENTIIYIKNNF